MSNVKTLTEETFDAEVLAPDTTVMVELGATWCGPCKTLAPILEKVAAEGTFKVFQVDIDDSPAIAKKYNIRGVPTVLVFKDGKLERTQVGLTTKDALLKLGTF